MSLKILPIFALEWKAIVFARKELWISDIFARVTFHHNPTHVGMTGETASLVTLLTSTGVICTKWNTCSAKLTLMLALVFPLGKMILKDFL